MTAPRPVQAYDSTDRQVAGSNHLLVVLWILQASLAVVFAWAGWTKVVKVGAGLAAALPWTTDVPAPLVRVIGVCEVLGAVGLVLPAMTRIRPKLTPIAASFLTTVMALAVMFHLYRGEVRILIVPSLLGAASALVAWGRFRKVPIAPRFDRD
jgi:putative oxidoreductase